MVSDIEMFNRYANPQANEYVVRLTEVTRYNWKNKCGTSDKKCNCGPWKAHWEKFSKEKFDEQLCSNEECPDKAKRRKAEHGAHVIHSGANDRKEWIVPLCAKCNNTENTEPFDLRVGTILVWANKGETCEN